jgi:hypothetical protein
MSTIVLARCANAVTRFTRLDEFPSWENHTARMELERKIASQHFLVGDRDLPSLEMLDPIVSLNPVQPERRD